MGAHITPDMPSEQASAETRPVRHLFITRFKATDTISGMEIEGLTTDLSEGGCCVMTRKGPFSTDTRVLLEITKNRVSLSTIATVVYNLNDQIMGLRFAEMTADQAAILADWIKAEISALNSRESTP